MIKFLVLTLLFLVAGYLFNPYITSLVNYVSLGLSYLISFIEIIALIISTFLNSFIQYHYILLILSIFICLKVFFYLVDMLGGE